MRRFGQFAGQQQSTPHMASASANPLMAMFHQTQSTMHPTFPVLSGLGGAFSPSTTTTSGLLKSASYQVEIGQMMYTFGEARHPMPETVQLVEQLVLSQLCALLKRSAVIAARRSGATVGTGKFSIMLEDVLFVLRRDYVLVAKVKEYLSWRKVRLVANRAGGGGKQSRVPDEDDFAAEVGLASDKAPAAQTSSAGDERQKIRMFWDYYDQWEDMIDSLAQQCQQSKAPSSLDADVEMANLSVSPKSPLKTTPVDLGEGIKDLHADTIQAAKQCRLRHADKITAKMSPQEYMDFAECRQASFIYKKPSKFRDWLNVEHWTAGARLSHDMMDIMGFIAYELVRKVTEHSLLVKEQMDSAAKRNEKNDGPIANGYYVDGTEGLEADLKSLKQKYDEYNMFRASSQTRTPLRPEHVLEAHRRLYYDEPVNLTHSFTSSADLSSLLQFENMSSSKNRLSHAVGRMTRTSMNRKSRSIII